MCYFISVNEFARVEDVILFMPLANRPFRHGSLEV